MKQKYRVMEDDMWMYRNADVIEMSDSLSMGKDGRFHVNLGVTDMNIRVSMCYSSRFYLLIAVCVVLHFYAIILSAEETVPKVDGVAAENNQPSLPIPMPNARKNSAWLV
jgi:hypothetical protein